VAAFSVTMRNRFITSNAVIRNAETLAENYNKARKTTSLQHSCVTQLNNHQTLNNIA